MSNGKLFDWLHNTEEKSTKKNEIMTSNEMISNLKTVRKKSDPAVLDRKELFLQFQNEERAVWEKLMDSSIYFK